MSSGDALFRGSCKSPSKNNPSSRACRGISSVRLVSKGEPRGTGKEGEADEVIPAEAFPKDELREDDENNQRDDLLQDFELVPVEYPIADPVGRDLEAILEEG